MRRWSCFLLHENIAGNSKYRFRSTVTEVPLHLGHFQTCRTLEKAFQIQIIQIYSMIFFTSKENVPEISDGDVKKYVL